MKRTLTLMACSVAIILFVCNATFANDSNQEDILKKIDTLSADEEDRLQEIKVLAKDCDVATANNLAIWALDDAGNENSDKYTRVLTLLGFAGHPEVIPHLQKGVLENKFGKEAILSIGLVGGDKAIDALNKILSSEIDEQSDNYFFAKRMQKALKSVNWKDEVKLAYAMSFAPPKAISASIPIYRATYLGPLIFPEMDSDFLIRKLSDLADNRETADMSKGIVAALWLARKKEKRIIPLLEKLIENEDDLCRRVAAEALGILGDKDSMIKYLQGEWEFWERMLKKYSNYNIDEKSIEKLKSIANELNDGDKKKYVLETIKVVAEILKYQKQEKKTKKERKTKKEKLSMLENGLKELKSLVAMKQEQELLIAKLHNRTPVQFPEDKDIKKFEKWIAAARTRKPSDQELEKIMNMLLIKTEELKKQISDMEAILTSDPEPGS